MPKACSFSIGYVSLQTGLSTHVIRAWERRYQAVTPERSGSGRRLYRQSDVNRLGLLKQLLDHGHRISAIAGLSHERLTSLIQSGGEGQAVGDDRPTAQAVSGSGPPAELIDQCLEAVGMLDHDRLYRKLQDGLLRYSRQTFLEAVIRPMMIRVGRQWAEGTLRIVHGHLAAGVVHSVLNSMLNPCLGEACGRPRMLIAAPAGQRCYLGALAVAVAAQDHGWRPVVLGCNLPAEEIAAACAALEPQMIALSITCRVDDDFTCNELKRLAELVDGRCRIMVGGHAGQHYRQHVVALGGVVCETVKAMVRQLY